MPITTPGIILPSGRFLSVLGDGHAKTAIRFCEKYPKLDELRLSVKEFEADEFMISAGCAIIAGYRGKQCFKIAQDNTNLGELIPEYEAIGFDIWPYWNIKPEYEMVLNDVMREIEKMSITTRGDCNEFKW